MKTLGMMTLTATLLATTGAQALTQNVSLDLNNQVIRGENFVPLKRMMRTQLGPQAVRGWTVTDVEVEAKSKRGMGEISLQVGHNESMVQTIPGTPEQFDSNSTGFTTLSLKAPYSYRGDEGRGPIRLNTYGVIKLDDVKVKLKKNVEYDFSNTRGMRFSRVKEFKAQKVIGSSKTMHVNGNLRAIKLVGTKKKVHVSEVKITYMNGMQIIVDELDGKLKEGRMKSFALRGPLSRGIKKVEVSATTLSLFGSRGRIAVELAR